MLTLLVPAAFVALFLITFALVCFLNPYEIEEREQDVRDSGGNLVKMKVPTKVWSPLGACVDMVGIVLIPILAICIFLLITRSDNLVQTRLGLWKLCTLGSVKNPDGAHAVLDAPDALKVTADAADFTIPEGVDPLWVIVTVSTGKDVDSLLVPLSSVKEGKVNFKHAKITTAEKVKVMYGTATGPSAEAEWINPTTVKPDPAKPAARMPEAPAECETDPAI